LLPIFVVVLSLTVGGGLLAREFYRFSGHEPGFVAPSSSATPTRQPGSMTVELSRDSAAHPQEETIRQLIQTYFDAINTRNYERWKTTVTKQRIQARPADMWAREYQSTKDGSVLVYRIETLSERQLQVFIGFTSTQSISAAPPDMPEPCIRWRLIWPIAQEGDAWKLDTVPTGTVPEHAKC
jgi:hypothetical protein